MIKKSVFILIVLLVLTIFYSLARQIYESLQTGKRLDNQLEELSGLQHKNVELKKKLEKVQTPEFIEEQARNKLNLAKEGETVVIIPQEVLDKVLNLEQKAQGVKVPHWQGWLRLLWH